MAELIARQRFNLNRANRLAKHKPTDKTIAEDPLKIAGFEETLAGMTRELTEGVEGIVGQRIEPLHAAEESMLAAVAALDHGQNARSPGHMSDALRHLIKARDTLRVAHRARPATTRRAMRSFDRMQAQKIRKPKKDEQEAEEIAEELEALAQEEDFVYETLGGILMEQQQGEDGKGGEAGQRQRGCRQDGGASRKEGRMAKELPRAQRNRKGRRAQRDKAKVKVRGRPATKVSRTTRRKPASPRTTNAARRSRSKRRSSTGHASWKRN